MEQRYWIDWTRTDLAPGEAQALLATLASERRDELAKRGFLWLPGCGVAYRDPSGRLRRARYTHGTYFRTSRGEFYVDSGGRARELEASRPVNASRPRP